MVSVVWIILLFSIIANGRSFKLKKSTVPLSIVLDATIGDDAGLVPRRKSIFPMYNQTQLDRTRLMKLDVNTLSPDDPIFLDLPWPEEHGAHATAFANHLMWKRRLSEGDRMRWQRWAIYRRHINKGLFQYNVEDYVKQNLLRDLESRARSLSYNSNVTCMEAVAYRSIAEEMRSREISEVKAVMAAFYSAFNRRSENDLRLLVLPDDEAEVMLPGVEKARGHYHIDKLFRGIFKDSGLSMKVDPNIVNVIVFGNAALVYTVETTSAKKGAEGRIRRGVDQSSQLSTSRKFFAATVLRFANKQWRILLHHCAPLLGSSYTGNAPPIAPLVSSSAAGRHSPVADAPAAVVPFFDELKSFVQSLQPSTRAPPRLVVDHAAPNVSSPKNAVVDLRASVTKQTVQALRYLVDSGKLTKQQKNDLMADIIDRIAHDQEAIVETSYKVVCAESFREHDLESQQGSAALEDFADQCHIALQSLYAASKRHRISK